MANSTTTKYVSKGERPNVQRSTTKSVKRDRTMIDGLDDIMKAYQALKNPWITISNPDAKATNKKKIRVRANDVYGDPKAFYRMAIGGEK